MTVIEELLRVGSHPLRRVVMATLPTPLESAGTLRSGRRLLLKRDDLTGLGMGGNKARKLETLCAHAIAQGCDLLVTVGASQSNHARVTAAAGARLGLETHIVLGGRAAVREGNQLLATLFGAHIHDAGTDSWPELRRIMDDMVQTWKAAGRKPYAMPIGGSTWIGALGFLLAWRELLDQLSQAGSPAVAGVVVASSTGGTHAGMLAGRQLFGGPPIYAMDVAKESADLGKLARCLADQALAGLGLDDRVDHAAVHVDASFAGADYAVPTAEADAAMLGLARSGGWVLDRVYTAKAFAGLVQYDRDGRFGDGDVVFWHTGGQPAVFAAHGAPTSDGTPPVLSNSLELR